MEKHVRIITSDQEINHETVNFLKEHREQSNFDFTIMHDLHTKMYLADNRLVCDGSVNFTKKGLWNQQNNITIYNNLEDYQKFNSIFVKIWNENESDKINF